MGWINFVPVYKERVWGGKNIARIFGRDVPSHAPIGESWEIVDRLDAQSLSFFNGRMCTFEQLMREHGQYVMGPKWNGKRFPILVKLLDCEQMLSVQVHPPHHIAQELHGESKDELWYIMDITQSDATIHVGLKNGMTRSLFEKAIEEKTLNDCLHLVQSKRGHAIFVPSGRVHAIGPGNVILEIQENSDTTYRVYDWDRPDLDGKQRQLHVSESLRSINFLDYEPCLTCVEHDRVLAKGSSFSVVALSLQHDADPVYFGKQQMPRILHVIEGEVHDALRSRKLNRGANVLLPYAEDFLLHTSNQARVLITSVFV